MPPRLPGISLPGSLPDRVGCNDSSWCADVIDSGLVGSTGTSPRGVPQEQKMLKGHLTRLRTDEGSPEMRALLGTAARLCEVVLLNLRSQPQTLVGRAGAGDHCLADALHRAAGIAPRPPRPR